MGNPILLFILAFALTVGGIYAGYEEFDSGSADSTAQNTTDYVNLMFSNIQSKFENNPQNFTGFDNTAAILADIPPSAWVPSGQTTNIVDPWGGQVQFATANVNGGTSNGYSLSIPNMPQAVCASVGSAFTSQTVSISINGTVIASNPSYGGTAGSWPPPPAAIQTACTLAANSVVWTQSAL